MISAGIGKWYYIRFISLIGFSEGNFRAENADIEESCVI